MNSGNYAYQCHEQKEAGDLTAAMVSCNKAIELDPKNGAAYYYRGNVHLAKGDFDRAIADYAVAITLDPKDENSYYYRGLARINKGDFDNAIADYTKYIELDPKLAEAYHNRALAKFKKQDYGAAIIDYTKAIELDSQLTEAYLGRADSKAHSSDRAGAFADYSEALKTNPRSSAAYAALGYLFYDSHSWRESLTNFRASIANGSSNQDYDQLRIFLIRARLGEREAAIKELEQYVGSSNGKANDWFSTIGRFLTGRISEQEFLTLAERGDKRTIQEQRCEAFFYAATVRMLKGENAKAKEYFQRSVETNVTNFTEYVSAKAELELIDKHSDGNRQN
jgi:tetratricopeptide (TPR) repeat protein